MKRITGINNVILFLFLFVSKYYTYEIPLDGQWKFAVDSLQEFNINNVRDKADWKAATVPLSWQAQFEKLRNYQGTAWYLKSINLPQLNNDQKVILKFEAVDYLTEVYVNNRLIGKHEGGYTPFEFEIQEYIHPDYNIITLKVFDPIQGVQKKEGINYSEIPHGKQSWYVQNSGIWQSCYIQIRPKEYIKNVLIATQMNGDVHFNILVNDTANQIRNNLSISIFDNSGKEVKKESGDIKIVDNQVSKNVSITNPNYWSIDSPFLYRAEIILNNKDTVTEQFGFRTFETKDKKFYLNDKPIYLIGALDQDFYPETIYSPPSKEYIKDEMVKAKKLGLNILRCHIKIPDKRYLEAADEVGILIWYEVPNRDTFTVEGANRSSNLLDKMLERDWNHPSIVILSLINESWGIDLQNKEQRDWLKKEYHRVKNKNTGWLVVDNSACYGNFHIATDINDYHTYWSIPDWKEKFAKTIKDVNSRPKWLFSNFGDSEETGEEPMMISEFGNWGLPKLPDKLPWWFDKGFEDIEITVPAYVKERFDKYRYYEMFNNLNELTEYSQKSQFAALKYEIEQIRMNPEIQGYIITEFTDLNWECNGLLDMWRNFKVYSKEISDIQQQDLIIPNVQKYSYIDGEAVRIDILLSHYSKNDLSHSTFTWNAGQFGNGKYDIETSEKTGISQIRPVEFKLNNVKKPENLQINFVIKDAQGNVNIKNFLKIYIIQNVKPGTNKVYVYDPSRNLNNLLIDKYTKELDGNKKDFQKDEIVLTNTLDDKITSLLIKGAKVLLLADSTTKFVKEFPYKLISRTEGWYDGTWISNVNWLKNEHQLFRNLKLDKLMGFESSNILPGYVLANVPAEDYSDVLAGMFVGWLHLNSAYVMQMKVGSGSLLVCTLPVHTVLKDDAYAKYLYNELISYLLSDNFNPKVKWSLK